MTMVGQPCPIGMSKSLVGRCSGKRVILWGRVCARGLDAAIATIVLFLIVTCLVGASSEAPFFERWWGRHMFVLLLGSLALAVLVGAALPLCRRVRVPLDQLPELDAASDDAGPEGHSARRIPRRGVAALVAVVAVPLLVVLFYLESGNGQESGFSWQSAVLAAVPTGWLYLEELNYSRTFQDYLMPAIDVPGGRVSPDACRRATAYLEVPSCAPWPARVIRHQFFSSLLLPGLSGAAQKIALVQTGVDCAALACALERFRLAHGQFPESLDALMPKFSSQLPHDVVTGQPLKYRRTADGQYLLYSVGWNQTDDGGVLGLTESGHSIEQKTGDWIWRLPGGASVRSSFD